MRILVTGHEGFIGKNLASYLNYKGHEVEGWEWQPNKVPDPAPYDRIIHMGAISSTTETDIDKVWEQNYEFSMRLLQVCDKFGTTLMYASSANQYGNINGNVPIKENDKKLPTSPYGWSKYLFDRSVLEIPEYTCNVQGFRFFNVYGHGEEHKGDQMSVFHKFEKQAKETGVIKVFEGSDKIYRDFIWVGDVCQIIEKFIDVDQTDVWNIGTGKARTFLEIANLYAKKYDAKVEEIPMPDKLKLQYQYFTEANIDKLSNTIGEYKFMSIEEYVNGGQA